MTILSPSQCSSSILALLICTWSGIAWAENAGIASGEPQASPAYGAPAQDYSPSTHEDDDSRPPEHLRAGVLGGVGFPRPLAIEGLIKVERVLALGAEYSVLPGMTISGAEVSFWAVAADVRVFPLRNAFFIGLRAGRQHLGGKGTMTVDPYGSLSASVSVATTFLNPRIGFLWTWDPGVTLGIDAGAQFPISAKTSSTLPPGNRVTDEVMSVAKTLGRTALPTIDLIRLGVLL